MQKGLGSIPLRLSFLFNTTTTTNCALWTLSCNLPLTINETLKSLSSLPILMQESFWWWQSNDRYIISLFPHLHTPFFPSLISLIVECCFTSTETVGLLGTGAQDDHLDFHTTPELCKPCEWIIFLNAHGGEVAYQGRGQGGGGGGQKEEWRSRQAPTRKTKDAVDRRQNNKQCPLGTAQRLLHYAVAVPTAVRNSHKDNVRRATDCWETTKAKEVQPPSPAPHPYSWSLLV